MELFHTGNVTKINTWGTFGSFLFFSADVYQTAAGGVNVYKLEIDDSEIIEACSLFYHEDAAKLDDLVSELAEKHGIDEDVAADLISEKANAWDEIEDCDAEISWEIQHYTAKAAKILGYRGVQVEDEQGAAYMIDMLGRESELQIVGSC